MLPSRFIAKLAGIILAALATISCGIRLPDTPPIMRTEHAGKTFVSKSHQGRDPDVLVWIVAEKLHTGMVFPYDWLIESGFIPPVGFGSPKYVTLSWGDRTAYVEKGLHTPWKFFKALFLPTPSVMELIPVYYNVVDVCPHQRVLRKLVPRERGKYLADFLNDCSRMDADGRPIVCGTSSWGGGFLLESRHIYFVPRTCNVWTVQATDALGCSINPWLAISADGLVKQAEKPNNGFEKVWSGD